MKNTNSVNSSIAILKGYPMCTIEMDDVTKQVDKFKTCLAFDDAITFSDTQYALNKSWGERFLFSFKNSRY